MRTIVFSLALFTGYGCGGDGAPPPWRDDLGPKGAQTSVAERPPGVDPGEGVDRGDGAERSGAPSLAGCRRDDDCARGVCFGAPSGSTGTCVVLCSLSSDAASSAVAEPCPRGEACVLDEDGTGVCLRPCVNDADCAPTGNRSLSCKETTRVAGRWCVSHRTIGVPLP